MATRRRKGDRQFLDYTQQDGPKTNRFEGTYESIGSEPQPQEELQRPPDDPERIDPKDWEDMNRADDEHRKGGRQGPVPSFKDTPNFDNSFPYKPGGNPEQRYEIWRRTEVPTMQQGGMVKHGSSTRVSCKSKG